MNIFENLNESQRKAVEHIDGAMLILAGAGSGKTKTITTRLAYLISSVGISPQNILTLTFTNKAANTMKQRALSMLEQSANPLLCTFHKFGLLFLRLHFERLNRKNNFTIIDTDDGKKIIKDLLQDKSKENAGNILKYISFLKNESKSVQELLKELEILKGQNFEKYEQMYQVANYYRLYDEYLKRQNFVDFDDLLLLTNEILQSDESFAREQSLLYNYIMVDEYQDTNILQSKILKNLCKKHENIVVVGDDDQSIYSWRGAKIENILNFQNEYKNVKLVKLEQNYRSVGAILQAANTLISHNKKRLGKTLICTKESGESIKILHNENEKDESLKIAKQVKTLLNSGINSSQIAILFRVNALSRSIEEAFMKEKIPYKLLSGMKFYERLEVKDYLSYLRLIANLNDDLSFKRVINSPKRAIGQKALQKLEKYAKFRQISLFEALCENDEILANKKAKEQALLFVQNIHTLKGFESVKKIIENLDKLFKLKEYFASLDNAEERLTNIDELQASLLDKLEEDESLSLQDLLSEISLLSDQDNLDDESVCLMSVHASKGLEFDYVFIIGFDEGFFPLDGDYNLEEERRLAYVGITRAKKFLSLSYANSRLHHGSRINVKPSRFLKESELKNDLDNKLEIPKNFDDKSFKKGDLIKHKIFGIGRIVGVEKDKLSINFGGIVRNIMSNFVEKVV